MKQTPKKRLEDRKYFTIAQVMDYFQVGRTTIYRKMKKNGVDPVMISDRSPRFTADQLEKMFPTVEQD